MSLRHVVCIRFQPGTAPERARALADGLRELPDLIPEIAAYAVGLDLGINESSWDFAVTADFASTEDYRVYRDHPEHTARIESLLLPITEERVSLQFAI